MAVSQTMLFLFLNTMEYMEQFNDGLAVAGVCVMPACLAFPCQSKTAQGFFRQFRYILKKVDAVLVLKNQRVWLRKRTEVRASKLYRQCGW